MYVSVPCARTHRAPPGVCLEGDLPLPRWLLDLGHAQGDEGLGEKHGGGPKQGQNKRQNKALSFCPLFCQNKRQNKTEHEREQGQNRPSGV